MIARIALHVAALWAAWDVLFAVARASEAAFLPFVALAACIASFLRDRGRGAADPSWSTVSTACLFAYAASTVFLPRLVAVVFALASFGALLAARVRAPRRAAGIVALALAAAPLADVLQAVAGTPLRIAVAQVSALFLSCAGLGVDAHGVALADGARTVFVDPACSGLRYLWCAGLLAAALAAWSRLPVGRTLATIALALPAAFVANVFRTASAFLLERSSFTAAHASWVHSGVGVAGFALACAALVLFAERARRSTA